MGSEIKNTLYKFQTAESQEQMMPQEEEEQNLLDNALLQQNDEQQMLQDNAIKYSDITSTMAKIGERAYTYMDGDTEKVATRQTRTNSSMSHILDALQDINITLSNGVTAEDLANEEKAKEAQGKFLTVCQACRTYLRRHKKQPWTAEGRARRQMVEDLLEQTTKESIEFYERVKSYREEGIPAGVNITTWNDVLMDVRTEVIDSTKDDVKVSMGGDGTSQVHIIETLNEKGEKVTRFFKEKEDNITSDYREVFRREINKYDLRSKDEKTGEEQKAEDVQVKGILDRILKVADVMDGAELNNAFKGDTKDQIYGGFRLAIISHDTELIDRLDELQRDESYAPLLENLKTALWRIRQDLQLGSVSVRKAGIKEGANITKRNAATSRLADILGVSDLVVKSKMARVNIDGKKMNGMIMEEAKGENMAKVMNKSTAVHYTDDAFRRLINLQIFDTLCAQIDRHRDNYRVIAKKGTKGDYQVSDFKGIDNDVAFGALKFKDVCSKDDLIIHNMTKIADKNGEFTLPAVEAEFANKILALEPEQIRFQMGDLLDDDEMDALVDRIKGVQDLLKRTIANNEGLLINKDDKESWKKAQRQYKNQLRADRKLRNRMVDYTYFSPKYIPE
ncbi:MAG: hypothetical protein J6N76_05115 [Lachnospiraceae bacterium]|nr:hypothetical protein [Lachnospiraceae bacterium]